MKEPRKSEDDLGMHRSTEQASNDRSDGAMSPSMRELILSFGGADPDRTWDADAYTRRSLSAS